MHPFMTQALALAQQSLTLSAPNPHVGCVIASADGQLLGQGFTQHAGGAHAEIMALRDAQAQGRSVLGATAYVTLEPCVMCAGALVHARVSRLVYGAIDPKAGGVVSLFQVGQDTRLNHLLAVEGGLLAEESAILLKEFFRQRRGGIVAK